MSIQKDIHSLDGVILSNQQIAQGHYLLKIKAPEIASSLMPGQFIMLDTGCSVYLNRPFSILETNNADGTLEMIYKIFGKGTQSLSEKKENDTITVIGPLGNDFGIDKLPKNSKILMVAGGVGMPPLHWGTLTAKKLGHRVDWLMGAATKDTLLLPEKVKQVADSLAISTDDGSEGYKGRVGELLEEYLKSNKPDIIITCGPNPMMKAVSEVAAQNSIKALVSLEEMMGCGFGICVGCVYEDKEAGYKKSCTDGPVVAADRVKW